LTAALLSTFISPQPIEMNQFPTPVHPVWYHFWSSAEKHMNPLNSKAL
jgi:hypothetical protein